jgi:hypothetical protein
VPSLFFLWVAIVVAAGSRATAVSVRTYADGAPPGFAGGFGEQSCHACHFSAEPNTAPGGVTLAGVPDAYTPGEKYTLTVALTRPGLVIGGFQLTSRFKDGGAQAGALTVPPAQAERVKIDLKGNTQYAGQRITGTTPETRDHARWTIDWTAPATRGDVLFHVAANAADKDDSAMGDFVYTAVGATK